MTLTFPVIVLISTDKIVQELSFLVTTFQPVLTGFSF